jgi:hypothetical protein
MIRKVAFAIAAGIIAFIATFAVSSHLYTRSAAPEYPHSSMVGFGGVVYGLCAGAIGALIAVVIAFVFVRRAE